MYKLFAKGPGGLEEPQQKKNRCGKIKKKIKLFEFTARKKGESIKSITKKLTPNMQQGEKRVGAPQARVLVLFRGDVFWTWTWRKTTMDQDSKNIYSGYSTHPM